MEGLSQTTSSRKMTKVFKALGDGTRQEILQLLEQHSYAVGEIVAKFDLSQPTISRHLSVLKEASLVIDFGALHGLFRERGIKIAEIAPGLYLRCMGMAEICQAWGGLLTGLTIDPETRPWSYPAANQGALIIAARIDLFAEPADFKREMDEYVRRVGTLKPLEGYEQALTPGGLEADLEQRHRVSGIPVSNRHQQRLQRAADELGLEVPWAE